MALSEPDPPFDSYQIKIIRDELNNHGSIPSPEMLQAYNEIDPRFSERLIHQFELEQRYRQEQSERLMRTIEAQVRVQLTGMFSALVLLLAGLALAGYLVARGSTLSGVIVAVTQSGLLAATLVSKYMTYRTDRRSDTEGHAS